MPTITLSNGTAIRRRNVSASLMEHGTPYIRLGDNLIYLEKQADGTFVETMRRDYSSWRLPPERKTRRNR
jgi:hypothetical protein